MRPIIKFNMLIWLAWAGCGLPVTPDMSSEPDGGPDHSPSAPVCGNGIVEAGETCDDGNRVDDDGCQTDCSRNQLNPGDQTDFGLDGSPILTIADVDQFTAFACVEVDDAMGAIELVSSEVDAAQVILLPDEQVQVVQLPVSGTGYFTLEVPAWGAKMVVSTPYTTDYEIIEGDREVERRWNGTCGDQGVVQEGYVFHRWGAFTVRVTDESNERVPFTIIHTNP